MRINNYKTVLDTKTHMAYLVKEQGFNCKEVSNQNCCTPESVAQIMRLCYNIHKETEENCYLMCTDTKSNLIGVFHLSKGSANTAIVHPRDVMVKALLCNAVGIILIHNHPSQDTTPSEADMNLTKRMKQASEIVGLSMVDHVIVCEDTYFSFHENDMLES